MPQAVPFGFGSLLVLLLGAVGRRRRTLAKARGVAGPRTMQSCASQSIFQSDLGYLCGLTRPKSRASQS